MLTLYGNAFSPFARKVQLILEHKSIDYEYVDGLARDNRDRLLTDSGAFGRSTLLQEPGLTAFTCGG